MIQPRPTRRTGRAEGPEDHKTGRQPNGVENEPNGAQDYNTRANGYPLLACHVASSLSAIGDPIRLQRILVPSMRGAYRRNTGRSIGDSFNTSCRSTGFVAARVFAGTLPVVSVLPEVSTLARVLRFRSRGSDSAVLLARLWNLLGDLGPHTGYRTGLTASPSALNRYDTITGRCQALL
jgi:hypothetical protein